MDTLADALPLDEAHFESLVLEGQLMLDLTQVVDGEEALHYYKNREKSLTKIDSWQRDKGEVSMRVSRSVAVNAIFWGAHLDRMGKPNETLIQWDRADEILDNLIVGNPLNPQLRADRLEFALMRASF